jgi:hypothetical protein
MRRASARGQRGGSKLRLILWLLVLAAVVYSAVKVVPAYVNNYQLEQFMIDEARYAVVHRRTEEDVRSLVMDKITDLGIPATREDVTIRITARSVSISASYTVEVNLFGYMLRLNFNPSADSRSI